MKFPDAVDTASAPDPSGCVDSVENAAVTSKSPASLPNLLFFTGLPLCFLVFRSPIPVLLGTRFVSA